MASSFLCTTQSHRHSADKWADRAGSALPAAVFLNALAVRRRRRSLTLPAASGVFSIRPLRVSGSARDIPLVPEPGTAWRQELRRHDLTEGKASLALKGLATRKPMLLFSFDGSLLLRLEEARLPERWARLIRVASFFRKKSPAGGGGARRRRGAPPSWRLSPASCRRLFACMVRDF